ncbi:MAG: 3'-5' exonuclease [Verrucomicrobiota bacterium]
MLEDGRPSEVTRACRETFRFVFVDECQDINAAQDAILRAVSRDGDAANRFLVGDVKQSIYRFRLADPRIFQKYQEAWAALRGQSGQTLALTENFRSAEGLLRFINPLFRALMRPVVGGLSYDASAELHFGAPSTRAALSAKMDSEPRVRLHVLTRDEETNAGNDESDSRNPGMEELTDLPATEREALLIATELRQLKAREHRICDRQTGGFRAVEYSDMVVLLRATTGRTEVFAKAFHHLGVPLQVGRAGFLTAQEVTDVLNLLRLLDNPLQDLPLLAVLRSPFVGLSAEELVQLRMIERHGLLWNALLRSEGPGVHVTSEPAAKLQKFRGQFQSWRELIRHSSLTHCIETALIATHYESLLLAGERGAERVANVRWLIEMARRFDPFQREGLFRFLQFINEQEEAEVSHQPARTTHEAAVRVMTIHASKGLEFPVVVVAGLGGRFNLRDVSGDILLNEDLGLAPKILPPNTRSKYPSIAHWHAAQRERRSALGEELRLLYVAATRARDVLLLVGTASRKAEADRWQRPTPLTDHALLKANSYLDWLRLWFANATSVSDWQDANAGANSLLSWRFHAVKVADETSGDPASDQDPGALAIPTPTQIAEIQNRIARRYLHEVAVREPAKTTVTALRRRLADETDDEARKLFQPEVSSRPIRVHRPGSTTLSAAAVGIAHHTFQQFVAIHRTATELDLRNEAERMREAGALTEEQFAVLDFGALSGFWQSEIGAKLRILPTSVINREMPFTARISAKDLPVLNALSPDSPLAEEDFVVVQGQVDLAVLLPDEIWLLDFKTDRVNADELPAKVTQYEPQLKIYALALARIYQRPVTQCWLHFLAAQKTVPIEPPACI